LSEWKRKKEKDMMQGIIILGGEEVTLRFDAKNLMP